MRPLATSAPLGFLMTAFFLFLFGFIAQEIAGGETSALDRRIVLALRDPANPSLPVGPVWLQEAARDVTSLGSIVVVAIITIAGAGYLLIAGQRAWVWLMLAAVFGGIALVDVLKLVFARPRPDEVWHAARVFTASFPSGHASLSAIAYLTVGGLLARAQSSPMLTMYFVALAAFLTVLIGASRIYLGFTTRPTYLEDGASGSLGR